MRFRKKYKCIVIMSQDYGYVIHIEVNEMLMWT